MQETRYTGILLKHHNLKGSSLLHSCGGKEVHKYSLPEHKWRRLSENSLMEILAEILVFSKTLLQIFKDLSLMLHFPSQVIILLLLNTPLKVQITYM